MVPHHRFHTLHIIIPSTSPPPPTPATSVRAMLTTRVERTPPAAVYGTPNQMAPPKTAFTAWFTPPSPPIACGAAHRRDDDDDDDDENSNRSQRTRTRPVSQKNRRKTRGREMSASPQLPAHRASSTQHHFAAARPPVLPPRQTDAPTPAALAPAAPHLCRHIIACTQARTHACNRASRAQASTHARTHAPSRR